MIKNYIYIVQTGNYNANNLIEGVYMFYNDSKKKALELIKEINEMIEDEYNDMLEFSISQNFPSKNIPPMSKMVEVEEDFWTSDIEWVSIEKHLLE